MTSMSRIRIGIAGKGQFQLRQLSWPAVPKNKGKEPATADKAGLLRLPEREALPWYKKVHLDRELGRSLAILMRLKDLRQATIEG
jgi:hypothetical protein